MLQEGIARVEQQDGKHLVVDDAGHQFGNSFQQLVNVENGGQFAADLGQQGQLPRLSRDPGIQPRVLDATGDTRREQRQQALVFLGERARLGGFHVNDADYLVLGDQGSGQLRSHAWRRVDEILLSRHIVDQNSLAALYSLSGNDLPNLNTDAFRYLGRMADLETDAQLLRLLVEQQNGKNFVIDDPLQHLCYALQQSVQIQSPVDRVSDFQQVPIDGCGGRGLFDGG